MIRRVYPPSILALLLAWPLVAFAQQPAQPRTVDGVAIDPDAELVVALSDDTTDMRLNTEMPLSASPPFGR